MEAITDIISKALDHVTVFYSDKRKRDKAVSVNCQNIGSYRWNRK